MFGREAVDILPTFEDSQWKERVEVLTKSEHELYQRFAGEIVFELLELVGKTPQPAAADFPKGDSSNLTSLPISNTNCMQEAQEMPSATEKVQPSSLNEVSEDEDPQETFVAASEILNQAGEDSAFEINFLECLPSKKDAGIRKNFRCRDSIYRTFDPFANTNSPMRGFSNTTLASPIPDIQEDFEESMDHSPYRSLKSETQNGYNSPNTFSSQLVPIPETGDFLADSVSSKASPNLPKKSPVRYSEEEFQELKKSLLLQAEKESEIIHQEYRRTITDLENKYKAEENRKTELKNVLDQYEKTISKMIEDGELQKEKHTLEISKILKEKEAAVEDLASVESSFSDLYRRFEKMKDVIESYKSNEKVLRDSLDAAKLDLENSEKRYDQLRQHAEKKIEAANLEIEKVKESSKTENAILKAKLHKCESRITSVEQLLATKERENSELVCICDELIAKIDSQK